MAKKKENAESTTTADKASGPKYSPTDQVKILRPDFGRVGSLGHTQFQELKAVVEEHGDEATAELVVKSLTEAGRKAWPALHYYIRMKAISIG